MSPEPLTFGQRHDELMFILVSLGWLSIGPMIDWLCGAGGAFGGLWIGFSFIAALLISVTGCQR